MLGRWNTLAPACTTRGPWASSRPGSVPMRTASPIWGGCAGPPASSVPPVVTPGASAATPDSRGSPHRYGTRPGTRPRTPGSARRREGVPPPQHSPVKWIPPRTLSRLLVPADDHFNERLTANTWMAIASSRPPHACPVWWRHRERQGGFVRSRTSSGSAADRAQPDATASAAPARTRARSPRGWCARALTATAVLALGAALLVVAPARPAEAADCAPSGGASIPAAAAPDGELQVSGRGWGHGAGMSQYGALGAANPVEAADCAPSGGASIPAAAAPDGELQVSGRGWGHGAGMSQYGALGAANLGCDYREILTTYFPGTTVGAPTAPPNIRAVAAVNSD